MKQVNVIEIDELLNNLTMLRRKQLKFLRESGAREEFCSGCVKNES